jgi:hypothetical protein
MVGDVPAGQPPALELPPWRGRWSEDDPDAAFKAEVRAHQSADPLTTITNLSARTGIPVPALVRYVLVRWASAGSEALLQLGPHIVQRMQADVRAALDDGSGDAARDALVRLEGMLSWLLAPFEDPDAPDAQDDGGSASASSTSSRRMPSTNSTASR